MKKNLLSRIILGALVLLVIFLVALPFVLRRFGNRLPKINNQQIGDNITITPTQTTTPEVTPSDNSRRITLQQVNKSQGNGEVVITKTDDHWNIGINTTLPLVNDAYYGIWLVRTAKPASKVFLGALTDNKGGSIADFTSTTDLGAYQQVWITIQTNSKTPGTKVLVGNL